MTINIQNAAGSAAYTAWADKLTILEHHRSHAPAWECRPSRSSGMIWNAEASATTFLCRSVKTGRQGVFNTVKHTHRDR